jgi:hypothetical protein
MEKIWIFVSITLQGFGKEIGDYSNTAARVETTRD